MSSSLRILPADGDRQVTALKILFSRFPVDEQAARLEDTLLSVQRGALNLSGLWLAEQNDQPVAAALVMAQPDGVSLVWPPVVNESEDEPAIRTALMDVIRRQLDEPYVKFGQILLSPEEIDDSAWLAEYGFESAAELFFLARSLEEPLAAIKEFPRLELETYDESRNADRFAALIEASYLDSLDCPLLNGTRTGVDALAGHRLSGQFHPRGWRLYQYDAEDAAVLLLNEHPDQDAVELVYFGVAPKFRGRKLGEKLLHDAIRTSQAWNRAVLFLAVDAGNSFANRLYAEAGFQEVARRAVWLRFPSTTARQ